MTSQEYIISLFGEKALSVMQKHFTEEEYILPKINSRVDYLKAAADIDKRIKKLKEVPSFSDKGTPHTPSTTGNGYGVSLRQVVDTRKGNKDYVPFAEDTLAYLLTEPARRELINLSVSAKSNLEKDAAAVDTRLTGKLEALLGLLRPLMILACNPTYTGNEERLVRHIERARPDIMDMYFVFFAPIAATMEKLDPGNRLVSRGVSLFEKLSADTILKDIKEGVIHKARASLELVQNSAPMVKGKVSLPPNAATAATPPYFGVKVDPDGLMFYMQISTGGPKQSSTSGGIDNGTVDVDCTEQVLTLMNALFKE